MESSAGDPFGWVGATVDGKYRIDAVVGEGGFGIVYCGRHLGFDEKVAVKCLRVPPTLAQDERDTFFQSFMAEGRLLHRLSRSTAGIVQALDQGATVSPNGVWTPYLVLEWLEGRPLENDLEERRKSGQRGRTLVEALELLDPVGRALALAHEQGVAHRDVKPANLFIAEVGGRTRVKVLDFGIAKVLTETASLTKAYEATGRSLQAFTPRYGAPEQFSRRYGATGPWTDVFSLALVFVEVVCGHPVLEGDDAAQLFVSAADRSHRPTLRANGVGVPDEVEAVLATALEVDLKERYPNAGEFWEALTNAATRTAGYRPPKLSMTSVPDQGSNPTLAELLASPSSPLAATGELRMPSAPDAAEASNVDREKDTVSISGNKPDAGTQLSSSTPVPRGADLGEPRMSVGPKPTPRRFALGVAGSALVFGLVAASGYYLLHKPGAARHASAAAHPASAAAVSAPRTSGSAAVTTPPPFPERAVAPGKAPETNIWLDHFRVMRLSKDSGHTFVEAHQRCAAAGMELCSEPEWARACAENPELGRLASWTSTGDPNGIVVRGGSSCESRKLVPGADRAVDRTGLCCERSIGIDSINSNRSFLMTTSQRVLALETILNQKRATALTPLLDENVTIDGKPHPRQAAIDLISATFRKWPDEWLASGSCVVKLQQKKRRVVHRSRWHRKKHHVESLTWSADCRQTRFRDGQIAVVDTTYIFGGNGLLKSIEDSRMIRDWSKP